MNTKLKNKYLAMMAVVFLVALPCMFAIGTASASTTGTVSAAFLDSAGVVSGTHLDFASTDIGSQVVVLLRVTGTSIWAVKTDVTWNNAVVHLTGVVQGNDVAGTSDVMGKTPASATLFIGDDPSTYKVDASGNGYINGGISETRTQATVTSPTNGAWCTLYFTIVGSGDSNIAPSNAIVENTDTVPVTASTNGASLSVAPGQVVPEYAWGALAALVAAFAAFIGLAAFKKISIPSFAKKVA